MKARGTSDIQDHKQHKPTDVAKTRKTVTDPTTGTEVQIEDVNADFMRAIDDLKVRSLLLSYRAKLTY
jgi:hypothetical protein